MWPPWVGGPVLVARSHPPRAATQGRPYRRLSYFDEKRRVDAVSRRSAALDSMGSGAAGAQLLDRALDFHSGPRPAAVGAVAGGAGAQGGPRPPRSHPDEAVPRGGPRGGLAGPGG